MSDRPIWMKLGLVVGLLGLSIKGSGAPSPLKRNQSLIPLPSSEAILEPKAGEASIFSKLPFRPRGRGIPSLVWRGRLTRTV